MKTYRLSLVLMMLGAALCLVTQSSCCNERTSAKVTVNDVDKLIKEELPLGSTKSQAISFVDSLRIDSLKVVRDEYYDNLEGLRYHEPDNKLDELRDRINGYLIAAILDVEKDCLTAYHVRMTLYFDRDERLIYHTVKRQGAKR